MQPRAIAALLVLAGGLVLALSAVLSLIAGSAEDWHDVLALVGYGLALAGLAVGGYLMVASAPVWLGIIVAVCLPLLTASVWQALTPALEEIGEGWKGPVVVHLVAGAVALVVGLGYGRWAALREPVSSSS